MSNSKILHIVSFDVPFPPNYGGVIDVYYKCKYLHQLGAEIILHCFEYGRDEAPELERYCTKVYYYKRKRFINPIGSAIPYIVKSRINKRLISNLKNDSYPILMEGLHTTYPLVAGSIDTERCYVRTHNIEHEYYKRLESVERSLFKRHFFKQESKKLSAYEKVLARAKGVLAISLFDTAHFAKINENTQCVSAFHESEKVEIIAGRGNYLLYHGNLAVGENEHAALYLANEVFPKTDMPCVIAGNNASSRLKSACLNNNIELKQKISSKEIIELIQKAHINILPTFQKTGIKLKLLNALFKGRHCIVNGPMVEDTGLESLCHIAENAKNMALVISQLKDLPFTDKDIEMRITQLQSFNNDVNAQKIMHQFFGAS